MWKRVRGGGARRLLLWRGKAFLLMEEVLWETKDTDTDDALQANLSWLTA